jgi:hypothetical protein
MPTYSFPISTARDLLKKARREIDLLDELANGRAGTPRPIAVAELTMNAAWSLWHTTEWIGNSSDPKSTTLVMSKGRTTPNHEKRTKAFLDQICDECEDLAICRALAQRFTQFELMLDTKAQDVMEVDHAGVPSLSEAPRPSGSLHPKVISKGQYRRLLDVYRRAYTFLDHLLKKHGL